MNIGRSSRKKVLVVVHDAGEAEIIGAYLMRHGSKWDVRALAMGPAAVVFERRGIEFDMAKPAAGSIRRMLAEVHPDFVLLGTGDGNRIGWKYVAECRRRGIRTVGYLDHWVVYRERFGYPARSWQDNVPDELWVGDPEAKRLAFTLLPKRPVRLVPNEHLREIKKRYREIHPKRSETLLFLAQPIPYNSKALLEELLRLVAQHAPTMPVRVRLHPRERAGAYTAVLKPFKKLLDVAVSQEPDLLRDIAQARVVVGMDTVALVIATQCGKRAVSILPRGVKNPLPFKKITTLRSVEDVKRLW